MRRWLLLLVPLWLAAGGCSGGNPAAEGLEVPRAKLASEEARVRGRELYLEHCALCHGERADGHGVRRNLSSQPADFTNANWRRRVTPEEVFLAIRDGVPHTAMPAWKVLDKAEIWDLTAYVLSVAEEGAETRLSSGIQKR
jgi:high-affinity iron transporter